MRKVIDYKIIKSSWGFDRFEKNVKDAIRDDWQPKGGIAIAVEHTPYNVIYMQAMVMYEDEDK